MAIMLLVLIQTLVICILVLIKTNTRILSFILFLIFIGGLIVLFVYITSLSSNEKFEIKNQLIKKTTIYLTLIMLVLALSTNNFINNKIECLALKRIIPLFSAPLIKTTIIVIIYLLLALIIIINISKKNEGPLRNTIKK